MAGAAFGVMEFTVSFLGSTTVGLSVFGAIPLIINWYPMGRLGIISGFLFSNSSMVIPYCLAMEYLVSFGSTT